MSFTKIFDIIDFQFENFPLEKALSGKKEDNSTYSYSTKELKRLVNRFSSGLLRRGLSKGDKISLVSNNNRPEWNIADLGMLQAGMINVSVYPNISPEDYIYIFNNAEVKYCITGSGDLLDKILIAQRKVPSLEKIFTFDEPDKLKDTNGNKIESWKVLIENEADNELINNARNNIKENDLATIIYTSGTTGIPKGVMLSHKNIVCNAKAISEKMLIDKGDKALSFLPLCHGFERTFVYCYIYKSIEVHYTLNFQTVVADITEVCPNIITTVPAILEKIYEKVINSAQKSGKFKRAIFFWAESLTDHFDFDRKYSLWYRLQKRMADKLVYSKIRNKLGGKLKLLAVGASACPQKILKFFCTAGIPVREGYGLTETSAVLSVNEIPEQSAMLETVGALMPNFEIKIDDSQGIYKKGEGEILVRGNSITKGYYKDDVRTAEVFNEEGWFLTGDIGLIIINESGQKFIKLTGRKKELLKSSNGKYIAPVAIENLLKESFFVSQIMAIGEQRKYVSALIVPEFDNLTEWCKEIKIEKKSHEEIIKLPEVQKKFQSIIDEANKHLPGYEQIRKFTLLPESWRTDTNELTHTLKLKREIIEKKFSQLIGKMYDKEIQRL